MDDDFLFSSVWGAPTDPSPILPLKSITPATPLDDFPPAPSSSQGEADGDDDFDDFGTAPSGAPSEMPDDDFGDFGDFGEAETSGTPADFGDDGFGQQVPTAGPPIPDSDWESLMLEPLPSRTDLQSQLDNILGPILDVDISEYTTGEDLRQVEGLSQILITAESRDLYNVLFHSPPPTKLPNWTRSRIRQQHLISLGIPVNLDEILPPRANGKSPLPPLQISTRPQSAPPPARDARSPSKGPNSTQPSRSGTPQPSAHTGTSNVSQLGLGPKPELDEMKVNELIGLDPQTLPLLPLPALERHLADLRIQTSNMSSLLTHLLQTREALQQDSETYNGLIAELVNEAQKTKIGKGKQPSKRGSMM